MWIMGILKGLIICFLWLSTRLPVEMLNVPQGGGYMYMCYMC